MYVWERFGEIAPIVMSQMKYVISILKLKFDMYLIYIQTRYLYTDHNISICNGVYN